MKTLKISNDYIGFLETANGINTFYSYTEAVENLLNCIKNDFEHLLKEYPKSKWTVEIKNEKTDRWEEVYSILTSKIIKMQKQNIF